VCLLTNGGHTQDLFRDLYNEILGELTGIQLPARPEPPSTPPQLDLDRYVGTYARESIEMTLERKDDQLSATMKSTGPLAAALGGDQPPPLDVLPVAEDLFVARQPGDESWMPVVFFRLGDGSEYVHMGARATPKTSGQTS
jgi:hypothetical protein